MVEVYFLLGAMQLHAAILTCYLFLLLVWIIVASPVSEGEKTGQAVSNGSSRSDDSPGAFSEFFSSFYSKTDRYDLAASVLRTFVEHIFGVFYTG